MICKRHLTEYQLTPLWFGKYDKAPILGFFIRDVQEFRVEPEPVGTWGFGFESYSELALTRLILVIKNWNRDCVVRISILPLQELE